LKSRLPERKFNIFVKVVVSVRGVWEEELKQRLVFEPNKRPLTLQTKYTSVLNNVSAEIAGEVITRESGVFIRGPRAG